MRSGKQGVTAQPMKAAGAEEAEEVAGPGAATRGLLPALFIGVFMAALDTAIVAPAIPVLRAEFGVDNRMVALVTVVYVLFSLCATAPIASLGDRHGRRPVYLACISLFAFGSLLIAIAPNFWTMLAGRAIQGIGGGGIIPTASAVIGDAFAPDKRARALGLIGATYGMAFVLGPPVAGLVMVVASWHWLFLANLPIAAGVVWLALRALPAQRRSGVLPPLDRTGIVTVFLLLGALVLALTRAADAVTGRTLWPAFAVAVLVLLPVLFAVERRAAQPLIPLRLFANRQLALTYAATLGAGFGMGGVIFLSSIATLGYGVARSHAGFALLPLVLCSMVGSMGAGRLLNRLGARTVILAGFVLLAVGYGLCSLSGLGLAAWLAATAPVGLGIGIVVSGALRTIAIDEAPPSQRGAAQGLVNIFTSIGTLLSVAVIGALADHHGGSAEGFGQAYRWVALAMAAMVLPVLALRATAARQHAAH